MPNYTFSSLNDKEFELLVRDLLQKEKSITLESFKSGKDKGIDLRHISKVENQNGIVVQCKHWLKSGISGLKSHLKNKELEKVADLDPDRYLLVTSIELSPDDKEAIKEILAPYIKYEDDIIGSEDLNNYLVKYPEVEESHYKLWLSSVPILKKISTQYIKERSQLYADEITNKVKLFVATKNFKIAEDILDEYDVLLITGEPGIGKTMLSDFLIFKYLREDYELTLIHKDLDDAEEVFKKGKKQIFYFDDFLGRNYLEILSEKNFDSQLYHLIKAIKRSKNHYLILTSRTTIYNTAKQRSEIIDESFNVMNFRLQISDYNYKDRAKILYNHIYFSELNQEYVEKIIEDEFYFQIIKHQNFNPRIIEFICDSNRLEKTTPENYSKFILNSLNNPKRIWEKAFNTEISDIDRLFLLTLFSFDLPVAEEKFKKALDKRVNYEIQNSGFKKSVGFYTKSIETLLGGFIKRFNHRNFKNTFYLDFINPSIIDFFIYYLEKSKSESNRIIYSAKYYEQIRTRFINEDSELSKQFSFEDLKNEIIFLLKRVNSSNIANLIYQLINRYSLNKVKPHLDKLIPLILEMPIYSSRAINLVEEYYSIPNVKKTIDLE